MRGRRSLAIVSSARRTPSPELASIATGASASATIRPTRAAQGSATGTTTSLAGSLNDALPSRQSLTARGHHASGYHRPQAITAAQPWRHQPGFCQATLGKCRAAAVPRSSPGSDRNSQNASRKTEALGSRGTNTQKSCSAEFVLGRAQSNREDELPARGQEPSNHQRGHVQECDNHNSEENALPGVLHIDPTPPTPRLTGRHSPRRLRINGASLGLPTR